MRRTLSVLTIGCLLFLLVACASGGTPTHIHTPVVLSPTPTHQSIPSGTVLYQADWPQGLASWGNPPGWKIVNGMPQSDLSDKNALTVPYLPVVPDYAFVFRFQIVSVPRNGGYFVLKAPRTVDEDGYIAGILRLLSPAPHSEFANPQIQVYLDPYDAMDNPQNARPSDYEPGTLWHTYRIEVQGPQVTFLADGFQKGVALSTQTNELSHGPLQLISSGAIVRVSNVSILAL
jgi:hypothetical protein